MRLVLLLTAVATSSALAQSPTTAPVGSLENPRRITDGDLGPDIDPAKLAASPYQGIAMDATFQGFMSSAYAFAGVWVYAAGGQEMYKTSLTYRYPEFYRPTWGEVFDVVARQMRCRWSWDAKVRQFRFERTDAPPFFGTDLADGWRREDRGGYLWHAPKSEQFGMDIYYYGHFASAVADVAFAQRVREHFAVEELSGWPTPPTLKDMTAAKVNGVDAVALRIDTPRPGGVWRQWSLVVDGHAFVIVSAMPKEREAAIAPQVDQMVQTFALHPAATQPAGPAR